MTIRSGEIAVHVNALKKPVGAAVIYRTLPDLWPVSDRMAVQSLLKAGILVPEAFRLPAVRT